MILKEGKWRCAEEAVILICGRPYVNLESPKTIQHYVLKPLELSRQRSRITGLYQNDSVGAWWKQAVPNGCSRHLQPCADDGISKYVADLSARFAHLSKPTNEAERRGPEDVMIVIHHVNFSTLTQSSEHDSPNQRANLWYHTMIVTLPSRVNPTTWQRRKLFVASTDFRVGLCAIIVIDAHGHPRLHFRLGEKHLSLLPVTVLWRF